MEPTYGPSFVPCGAILLAASLLAALSAADDDDVKDDFVFYLTACANGMQNGLSSLHSGNLKRSTPSHGNVDGHWIVRGTDCYAVTTRAIGSVSSYWP